MSDVRFGGVKLGKGANRDRKVSLMRRAKTRAENKFSIGGGGRKIKNGMPSMPQLKCLEKPDDVDR